MNKKFKERNLNENPSASFKKRMIRNKDKVKNNKYERQYEKLSGEEKEDDIITPSMKKFRMLVGALSVVGIIWSFINISVNSGELNYKDSIKVGKIKGIEVGDRLSEKSMKFTPKDFSVKKSGEYGEIELSIWNFSDKEDGDYVQVLVNGTPQTEAFSIRHRVTKIGVPDKSIIQVKGIRDGSNNGITYAVFFNKTGETYLNTAPLNGENIYTLK
ncbi:hypothetical protein [Clostridium oceanicum]|uniref:DUF4352 domain-containing protein n=1 Tax=Clostridium oceanicum TaxID=1543 RepID=A0ABP3URT9_9CLOT